HTFASLGQQGTQVNINSDLVARTEVLVPPLPEQRKIAAILSSVDETIEKTEAVVAQLQVVKKAMMQELLTRGMPGRHTRFKQTEIGEIPEGWEVRTLGDCGSWFSGGTPSKANEALWRGSLPWVSPKDMKLARIGDAQDHVHEDAVGQGTRAVPPGTLLMVVRGMILAHSFPVCMTTARVAFNQDIKALSPSPDFDAEYLLYFLECSKERVLGLMDVANHGTKRLPTERLFAVSVPQPPLSEQRLIAAALAAQERVLDTTRESRARLLGTKAALSAALLSGDLRVAPDEVR
ncbi:MAG: restriction endonuclease subunit S, partial [Myxococcales bacterium]|nr:restriction endonuclease subunit S [Myxococcales bacterium]